jgi:ribosomal protein S18 acetylase RimI-like enzyme
LQGEADLQLIRSLVQRLPGGSRVVDLEEKLLNPLILQRSCLWLQGEGAAAFALVDDYDNLWFDIAPGFYWEPLGREIVDWAVEIQRQRRRQGEEVASLDASCQADDHQSIQFLLSCGFEQAETRSLHYERSLAGDLPQHPLPPGFTIRPARGEAEVDALVALHRAAFGTDHMTVEERLAIMRAPGHLPELDLLVVAPSGELAAFCICGLEEDDRQAGYTDPIGTHPRYQCLGLGKAVVSRGLRGLQALGAKKAGLGTSSENRAMQCLAEALGFLLVSEGVWFSKPLD